MKTNTLNSLPEMNSYGNSVHSVGLTPNEKSRKKNPLKPKLKCIQVRDLGQNKENEANRTTTSINYKPQDI